MSHTRILWDVRHTQMSHTFRCPHTIICMSCSLIQIVHMFTEFLNTQVLWMLIWMLFTLRCSLPSQKGWPHSLTWHSHALLTAEFSFSCAHQRLHMLIELLLTSTQGITLLQLWQTFLSHLHCWWSPCSRRFRGRLAILYHVSLGWSLCTLLL